MRLRYYVPIVGIVALVLAACNPSQPPSAADVVAHLQLQEQDSIHMVQELSYPGVSGKAPVTQKMEIWQQGPTREKEVTLPGSTYGAGTIVVRNDRQFSWYFPARNEYVQESIPATSSAGSTTAAVTTQDAQQLIDDFMKAVTLTYQGTDTVAGRTAYKFHMTPKPVAPNDASAGDVGMLSGTVWIDVQTWRILMYVTDGPNALTMRTLSIDENAQIPASVFTFTPPPGAKPFTLPPAKAFMLRGPLMPPGALPTGAR